MTATTNDRIRLLEQIELELTPSTPPACPDWCAKPAGHEYDSTDCDLERYADLFEAAEARDLVACRYHRREIRDVERESIDVEQLERAAVRAGLPPSVTLDEADIYAVVAFEDVMSAESARELAQAFLDAAALVERINEART